MVEVGDGPGKVSVDELPVHDETLANPSYAFMLSQLDYPDFPVPVGVLRSVEAPTYETVARDQENRAKELEPNHEDLRALWGRGDTWTVD